MHFFNPVPSMPLVEVIRGTRTSEAAVAKIVSYGVAMGKTPIVVKDGPGFLVNRIFTPYMQAFGQLIADGADFLAIDAAMEGRSEACRVGKECVSMCRSSWAPFNEKTKIRK